MTFFQIMRGGHRRAGRQAVNHVRNARRAAIKNAGGIRQFKRQQRKRDLLI
jgi:hypothetical protein